MSDRLLKESDVLRIAFQLPLVVNSAFADAVKALPTADRPQGYWTKIDVATYRCSECGKIQIADDVNELNFCCCCGSRNKIRRKGAGDDN